MSIKNRKYVVGASHEIRCVAFEEGAVGESTVQRRILKTRFQ